MIRLTHVSKTFDQPLLREIDLELSRGSIWGLVGPAAVGKSVLLKTIAGLIAPDEGTVTIDDRTLDFSDETALTETRRHIGMLFQNSALFDFLSVLDNVAFPLQQTGIADDEAQERAAKRLRDVGLAGSEAKFPSQLSGGMQKRVAIARAMVADPPLLLYDEPTAGLDPVTTSKIYDLLRAHHAAHRPTIVVVSSDVTGLMQFAEAIGMLHAGRLRFSGSAHELSACTDPVVRQFVDGALEGPLMIARVGATTMRVTHEVGGIGLLAWQALRALLPFPRCDRRELWHNLHRMGVLSLPIIALTAIFTGAILVVQGGTYVRQYGAHGLLGWGTGYSMLREIGPVLIALMFSGRVGSNNTAELGTMTITEQIDGLRALAIDPIRFLIVPRVLAMVLMLTLLTIFGEVIAIGSAAFIGQAVVGVAPRVFWHSFAENLGVADLTHGLIKAGGFGCVIALTSCYFGVTVRGGTVGVGKAVNASVVASAVAVLVLDCLLTLFLD